MSKQNKKLPDGGCLAWSIVAASFMVSFIQVLLQVYSSLTLNPQDGLIYSFGLLLPVISTTFGAGKTEASLVHTLMSLMTLGSGPVVAEAIKKFGHCLVSVVGTLLAMAGFAAAGLYISLTNEPAIAVLYLFVGILTGFGYGLT